MTTDIVIGVAGVILGVITSYIFYRIGKKRRELCWSIDSTNLIKGYSSLFEKLEIQYEGQNIENLTVSKMAFWNSGNETIDGKDIAIPPHIFLTDKSDTRILDAKIMKTSTIGNNFELHREPDDPIIVLSFNYVDPQQGVVIQVVHNGVSILPLMMGGEVKGVKEIEYKSKKPNLALQVVSKLFVYFNALTIFLLVGGYLYDSVVLDIPARVNLPIWPLVFALFVAVLFVIFDIGQTKNTAKIPKELSVFDKDKMGIKKMS